jgi:hypothetical protein
VIMEGVLHFVAGFVVGIVLCWLVVKVLELISG